MTDPILDLPQRGLPALSRRTFLASLSSLALAPLITAPQGLRSASLVQTGAPRTPYGGGAYGRGTYIGAPTRQTYFPFVTKEEN